VQDIDDNLPLLTGDKRRIRQILLNLTSNAAKFTDDGTITLSAKNRGDHVQLAVIDSGPGIKLEMQKIIFEPFMQTADGVKHADGTGLGLPITKSLVEAHHGRIWLESESGEGAAFYVALPIQMNHNSNE
jgi:signal transduction histidine kinase